MYLSFSHRGRRSWGLTDGAQVFDLGARAGAAADLHAHILSGAAAPAFEAADIPLSEVALERPLTGTRIFCAGLNYRDHVAEAGAAAPPSAPSIFTRTWESVVAAGAPVWRPFSSERYDYEGELAVVIGKPGRRIAEADALDHVFGYSIFLDGSVRDFQRASVTAGKNFERSGAFGPGVVAAAQAPAWDAMKLVTRLNGQVVQEASTGQLLFGVPTLIHYLSQVTTLLPGDVIATGTPSGVGAARKPPLWMKAGDDVAVEIAGLGVLRNPVVDEETAPAPGRAATKEART